MITKLLLHTDAPFTDAQEITTNKINYFFGSNGSGKTTISRLLENPSSFPKSTIYWADGPIEPLVYNKDFRELNFQQDTFEGIFTLGESDIETLNAIKAASDKRTQLQTEITTRKSTIISLAEKNAEQINQIKEQLWQVKQQYDDLFPNCLVGHKKTKDKFFEHWLVTHPKTAPSMTNGELKKRYDEVHASNLEYINPIPAISLDHLQPLEKHPIFSQTIVNNEDVHLSGLLKTLQNSDWVKRGVDYLEYAAGKCPFCQQSLDSELANRISALFDEKYNADCDTLAAVARQYIGNVEQILLAVQNVLQSNVHEQLGLDSTQLHKLNTKLVGLFDENKQKIDAKMQAPSTSIEINTMLPLLSQVTTEIDTLNISIAARKKILDNLGKEKNEIEDICWFNIHKQTADLWVKYENENTKYQKGKAGIEQSIQNAQKEIGLLTQTIIQKEETVSNTSRTVRSINNLLEAFGFTGFFIKEVEKRKYRVIRPDQSDAKSTLSEGEYNFLTFLYFYHLVKGSKSQSGAVQRKIVVIDDPVSSLDSNVLYIVSSLVRDIREYCRGNEFEIKQFFLLTHNMYFHKEVTFVRGGNKKTDEAFFLLKKTVDKSTVELKDKNPITNSYTMLWEEIKKPTPSTCCNAMRRILEYYFNIIGEKNYEKAINNLSGIDKQIGKTLIAFINDQSHFITDDLFLQMDDSNIENHLDVFKKIFCSLGHESHYKMMMGIE